MGEYRDFKSYMEDNFCDEIFQKVKGFISQRQSSFENEEVYEVKWVELSDIHVRGVSFKDAGNNMLEIRITVDADIDVQGKGRYGYDHFDIVKCYCLYLTARLENGLHNVIITGIEEYTENRYEKGRSLSQDLVPYMYEEDVEKHAEDFLRRHYPKALLQPMQIPAEELAGEMGMQLYYAPLEQNIFGKTYFGRERVTVYTNILETETQEIITESGTILINPNVYFMYNVGTANNTIIHECVHWDRHRRPFELQKLLHGNCNVISCEIVETYDGMPEDAPALKWMEWQANQLAPRILMPAEMTKRKLDECLRRLHAEFPFTRNAELAEQALGEVSTFFGVSMVAAKIRAIELGFDEMQGVAIYSNGRYLPPVSFPRGTLKSDQTFVIDEKNAMAEMFVSPYLRDLYYKNQIIYANSMVCINSPKYITQSETGQPILTDYALEHVHECCFVFKRKFSASDTYRDSFYRRCFLCREVNSETFIEAVYDEGHKNNQSKKEQQAEIEKITESFQDVANRLANEIPGGFGGTLKYHMKRKGITNEELSARTGISTVSISGYRNSSTGNGITIENAIALCNGLKLHQLYMRDFMRKAGHDLLMNPNWKYYMIDAIMANHADDTLEQWQEKFDDAKLEIHLPDRKIAV